MRNNTFLLDLYYRVLTCLKRRLNVPDKEHQKHSLTTFSEMSMQLHRVYFNNFS